MHKYLLNLFSFVVLLILLENSWAEDLKISEHLKLTHNTAFYENSSLGSPGTGDSKSDNVAEIRFNFKHSRDSIELISELSLAVVNLEKRFEDGGGVQNLPLSFSNTIPTDRTSLFAFSKTFSTDGETSTFGRFDRFSLAYSDNDSTLKIGRQALSWGQGLNFQVLDIVNPFPPATIDTEYKPGSDMINFSHSISAKDGIEIVYVPRRNVQSHNIEWDQSTVATQLRSRSLSDSFEFLFSAARHYNDTLLGFGTNTSLAGAIFRVDLSYQNLSNTSDSISVIMNVDRSWILFDHNWYGSLEYFHSGVGSDSNVLSDFSEELTDRLTRGDLFIVGTDYLSLGMRQELTPLFNLYELLIQSLDAGSALFQLKAGYDLSENLVLTVAGSIGLGGQNSEFQGFRLDKDTLIERGDTVFVQIAQYF